MKVDNIDGKITELSAGIEWRPFKNVGFELAYNRFDLEVSVEDVEDGFLGELDYDYKGPILGVTARF